jgi:hypothetical protein
VFSVILLLDLRDHISPTSGMNNPIHILYIGVNYTIANGIIFLGINWGFGDHLPAILRSEETIALIFLLIGLDFHVRHVSLLPILLSTSFLAFLE